MSDSPAEPTIVDSWLEPLGDPPCGQDLEWDNEFLEMTQAAVGKEASQFSDDAKPPDWRGVKKLAESLFDRTRDVRVAIYWTRAMVHLNGAAALADGLRLVHGLLERYWDDVHPKPDDGDAYARINALAEMAGRTGMVADLRQSVVVAARGIGEVSGRDVEIALGLLEARDGEYPPTAGQIEQIFADAGRDNPALLTFARLCGERLQQINDLMRERVGYGAAPELDPLVSLMSGIAGLVPSGDAAPTGEVADATSADADDGAAFDAGGDSAAAPAARRGAARGGLGTSIDTRADALRAIDMVCQYLERTEPTNPAQFLLRRARKLVDKNFLELVRELAPDSLDQVARIMGVSPEELNGGNSY